MTQEEKELLLKDLCARWPYGVKMSNINAIHNGLNLPPITVDVSDYENSNPLVLINSGFRPYLRSMSSMTEDEKVQLSQYACIGEDLNGEFIDEVQREDCAKYIDWLNKKMFDYRGLIKKGLAIEAPKGMYKTE